METAPNSVPLFTFTAPTGSKYTIREQNGNDDDIISNSVEAENLMNISRFISAIVVETDVMGTPRVITAEEAHNLPSLDRYCILLQSRIFSYEKELEFTEDWGDKGEIEYTQDLTKYLFDYSKDPTEEELNEKPFAIPYYPNGKNIKDLEIVTKSGKEMLIDIFTGAGEAQVINLPLDKATKNATIIARNLRLLVNGKYEKVTNFKLFSTRDMREIRKFINENDPVFEGYTELKHPSTNEVRRRYLLSLDSFFYPGED